MCSANSFERKSSRATPKSKIDYWGYWARVSDQSLNWDSPILPWRISVPSGCLSPDFPAIYVSESVIPPGLQMRRDVHPSAGIHYQKFNCWSSISTTIGSDQDSFLVLIIRLTEFYVQERWRGTPQPSLLTYKASGEVGLLTAHWYLHTARMHIHGRSGPDVGT